MSLYSWIFVKNVNPAGNLGKKDPCLVSPQGQVECGHNMSEIRIKHLLRHLCSSLSKRKNHLHPPDVFLVPGVLQTVLVKSGKGLWHSFHLFHSHSTLDFFSVLYFPPTFTMKLLRQEAHIPWNTLESVDPQEEGLTPCLLNRMCVPWPNQESLL